MNIKYRRVQFNCSYSCRNTHIRKMYSSPKLPPLFSNRIAEFTTSEAAIFYLTQNSLPNNLRCCRRHKIYHLTDSHLLSHTGFVSSYRNTCDVRENLLSLENAPTTGEIHLCEKSALTRNTT